MSPDKLRNKFRGSLLGVICGDVLGAPVEGLPAGRIRERFGRLTGIIPGEDGVARYTDDTQMTLALGRSMLRQGKVDAADCAASYAACFDAARGYGRSAGTIMTALRQGCSWSQSGTLLFPDGSFGNGAAMRIAPVGLVYGTEPIDLLREAVRQAVYATHTHPEAIDGAVLLARSIGRARDLAPQESAKLQALWPELQELTSEPSLRDRLVLVRELLQQPASDAEAQRRLGSGVRSRESVLFALFLALRYADQPLDGLFAAVNAGGDTDTVAAMTGSVLGALHGAAIFPTEWLELLEAGEDGVQGLLAVADGLSELAMNRGALSGC
jgi:poly(ADP-ribose) glycohydrolase ARH3